VADVNHDVSKPLPFEQESVDCVIARHVLEHLFDPITVLKQWTEVLKPGGKIMIAVPLGDRINSIPMNIEHVHAWDMASMKTLLETVGLKVTEQLDSMNGVSFITIAEKI
jgi:ubiquinone/menaquinone biosynthesis C-methylase UbiE